MITLSLVFLFIFQKSRRTLGSLVLMFLTLLYSSLKKISNYSIAMLTRRILTNFSPRSLGGSLGFFFSSFFPMVLLRFSLPGFSKYTDLTVSLISGLVYSITLHSCINRKTFSKHSLRICLSFWMI